MAKPLRTRAAALIDLVIGSVLPSDLRIGLDVSDGC
jgi:hypothetical protein